MKNNGSDNKNHPKLWEKSNRRHSSIANCFFHSRDIQRYTPNHSSGLPTASGLHAILACDNRSCWIGPSTSWLRDLNDQLTAKSSFASKTDDAVRVAMRRREQTFSMMKPVACRDHQGETIMNNTSSWRLFACFALSSPYTASLDLLANVDFAVT